MSGFDPDYGEYRAAPGDPRTPDEPERAVWEEGIAFSEILEDSTIDELLMELLYGNPDVAKKALDKALDVEFREHQAKQKRQDEQAADEARWAA